MNKCIFDSLTLLLLISALSSCRFQDQGVEQVSPGSPEAGLNALTAAEGLEVRLFASEPLISNPTNMDVDAKGRVWVTEAWNYRNWLNTENPYREQGDRIVILEDTDQDGQADTAKIFFQDTLINSAMGIAVLGNRVIVSCSPGIYVLTDTDGDDQADTLELLFSGIGGQQHDHAAHAVVFGPDGKLYFNFGNEGKTIRDAHGQVLRDALGRIIQDDGAPYREGMAFRCNPDGSGLEVIGHNFRNPYELAVDSYGLVWQTDNDDDGNRSTRLNFVMEYGNYGYTDELTGASWPAWRINREDSVPRRHWHQEDPGVVPNLLINGAGSPAGLCVYEGTLLPSRYQGQLIHAEPGLHAIRVYPVRTHGAGFEASRLDLLYSKTDNWFRPVDVCAAPDGSLMVADWYDPGVGGHRAGDVELGRIYRVAPMGHAYRPQGLSLETPEEAVKALGNPAQSVRYLAWSALEEMGTEAEPALGRLFTSRNPDLSAPLNSRMRARALWLLTKLPESGQTYLRLALKDADEMIRAAAVRAARQMDVDFTEILKVAAEDPSAQVRRTALVAMHYLNSPGMPDVWARFAAQYDGNDPWYLEALGIAAANQTDACFSAWLENGGDPASAPGRKITWRSRATQALPLLTGMAADPGISDRERRNIFRAFAYYQGPEKQQALRSLVTKPVASKEASAYALMMIDPRSLPETPTLNEAIDGALEVLEGKPEYIQLVSRFQLVDKAPELMKIALDTTLEEGTRSLAVTTLVRMDQLKLIRAVIESGGKQAVSLVGLLPKADDDRVFGELERTLLNDTYSQELRRRALSSLGNTWTGSARLMTLAETGELPAVFDSLAKEILTTAWRPDVLARARAFYQTDEGTESLPAVSSLLAQQGDATAGAAVFTAWCSSCHVVNGKGTSFGPELSGIGTKLSAEGLYDAILYPDKGINFGFEGYIVELHDGRKLTGYLTSETDDGISIRVVGGQTHQLRADEISSKTPYPHSLMPSGLGEAMGANQLINLVAYLRGLKTTE